MKFNTDDWKEFCVGELFQCDTTLGIPSKSDLLDGSINYVTRSAVNNGLSGTCGNNDHLNIGNCITVGAEGFIAFWQNDSFVAGNKVYTIRHDKMNEMSGLFVCTALNVLSNRYSFSEARVLDAIKVEVIKLPVTSFGEPDWDYMESYMRSVMEDCKRKYQTLVKIANEKHKIDTTEWSEFKIGNLFEIVNPKVYHTRQLTEVKDSGLPYITRGRFNNGLKFYVQDSSDLIHNPAGVISFGAEGSAFFFQKDEYVSGRDMYYIDTREISEQACLFLVSCLQTISDKYSYTNGMFPKKVAQEIIKLPVISSGEPDWNYMKSYMQEVLDNQQYVVSCLKQIV